MPYRWLASMIAASCLSWNVHAAEMAAQDNSAEASVPEPVLMAYRQTVKGFMIKLKGELQAAMKAGGPINAIGVCHVTAPHIAEQVSSEADLNISRVSLKNRNPNNAVAAGSWQESVLTQFDASAAEGTDPSTLEYAALEEIDGTPSYVYMKAIPTAELCLNCHGSQLKPEVQAKISELYPDDKATGYQAGDIRGAFVITQPMLVATEKYLTAK